jgi:hypothetical protein
MRLLLVTAWILAGAAVTGAAFWGLLNTPESTILALASSLVLVLLTVALLSVTINGAISLWVNGPSGPALRRSIRVVPAVIPALLVFALLWWMASGLDTWVALRSGGINAWFIATLGWDDMSWLFAAIGYFTTWMRWVLGGLLAVSLMGGMTVIGWRAGTRLQWIRRGLRPRTLIAGTLWFAMLIVLPWLFLVPWRPDWVPPTGAELAFIISKLSIAAILMAAGVALMIYEATRLPLTPIDPQEQRLAA